MEGWFWGFLLVAIISLIMSGVNFLAFKENLERDHQIHKISLENQKISQRLEAIERSLSGVLPAIDSKIDAATRSNFLKTLVELTQERKKTD